MDQVRLQKQCLLNAVRNLNVFGKLENTDFFRRTLSTRVSNLRTYVRAVCTESFVFHFEGIP